MKFMLRMRLGLLIYALFWAAGVTGIWWLMPVGPRDGWQPPRDEFVCGFLPDGRTLVTVPRSASGNRIMGTPETGPIRLWDIESGNLRASHFGPDDVFDRVMVDQSTGLLRITQRGPKADGHQPYYLRLHNAITGAEVVRFTCHIPRDNVWWHISADGRLTAFITDEGDGLGVAIHEISSGRRLHFLPGCGATMFFSPDGKRLAAWHGDETLVFDVSSGRELARLKPPKARPGFPPAWPKTFSPDGTLLLDHECAVWDVGAGKVRFQVPNIYYNSSLFTADGRALAVVDKSPTECWLAFYDTATGKEMAERRVRLAAGGGGMHLGSATLDGRLLLADGTPLFRPPSTLGRWLANLPYLNRISAVQALGRDKPVAAFVLVETATGREVMRGGSSAWSCTPDGRFILSRSRDEVYELWDAPARKPMRWIVVGGVVWSAVLGLSAWLIARLRSGRAGRHARSFGRAC